MDTDKLNQIWDQHGSDLLKPKILLAKDINNNFYYVIKDNSSIVFMIFKNSNITYSIPKKYLNNELDYYYITDNTKLISVSCPTKKDPYELFVQKYLMPK